MRVGEFRKQPILGILRGIELAIIEPLINAIINSGLKTIEIAMNTKEADKLIKIAQKVSSGQLTIGAGTVLDVKTLESALDSGASFAVMPVLAKGVANYCRKKKIPFFPGALSPQEIYEAWCSGAAMVKVFPAGSFGPAYFKEIKGPFKEIELLACSGVTAENIGQYFANGANAVAFGTSVFKQEWLKSKNFSKITQAIKELIDCLHKVS